VGAAALLLAGCGDGSSGGGTGRGGRSAWGSVPFGSGGSLPYPPGWREIHSDRGAASAALFSADGSIRAYLNATPAIAAEQPHSWAHFRIGHNADEGDRHVRLLSSGVRTLGVGRAACVLDQYVTSKSSYRELACLVRSSQTGRRTVLVAAAKPAAWASERSSMLLALRRFVG
jgi:hypothetical protein